MAGETVVSDINGVQKRVYDKSGLKNAILGVTILQDNIGWENGTRKIGESYQVGVVLRPPNGFTHAGSAGNVVQLKQGRPMKIQQASITPHEFELREQVSFAALSRAAEEGEGAFASLTGELHKAMKEQAQNRLEAVILHGQRGLGVVEAVTDLGSSQMDITITEATWRPGMWWALGEGTTLDSFTSATKNNGDGPLVLAGVKAASRKITVSHSATYSDQVAAGDVLYFEGAYDGTTRYEMPGLLIQSENTTGTSLGISAATYGNWKGNTYNVGGNVNSDVVEDAVAQLRDRGAKAKLRLYLSNKAYGAIMAEPKSQRMFDSSYSAKAVIGHDKVTYRSPDVGEIDIVNHPFMAWGEFLLQRDEDVARVGSADIMFGVPGSGVDAPEWERVPNYNAAEVLLFTDQAVLQKMPKNAMVGSGITYT